MNKLLSVITILYLIFPALSYSSVTENFWYTNSNPTVMHSSAIVNCGTSQTVSFRIGYFYNSGCPWGFGSNPYRFTFELYRDGSLISSQTFQTSSCWARTHFTNISATPGSYKAKIKLEKRIAPFAWSTVETKWTSIITAANSPAIPDFNINGISVPTDGSPINVNVSYIRLNAGACQCETKYFISVQESEANWDRTYDFEWGRWFTGAALNNLNLQQLTTAYSYPPDFTGPAMRQGSPLISGNLGNGNTRYYRVNVCTGEPSWNCKTALIRVNY